MIPEERKKQLEEELKKKGYKVRKELEYIAEEELFKGIVEDMEGKRLQIEIFGLAGLEECLMELLESDDPEDKVGQIRTHKLRNIPHANNSQVVIPPMQSSTRREETRKSEGVISSRSEDQEEESYTPTSTPKIESTPGEVEISKSRKRRNPFARRLERPKGRPAGTEKSQMQNMSDAKLNESQMPLLPLSEEGKKQQKQQEQAQAQQEETIKQQKQMQEQQKQMSRDAGMAGAMPGSKSKKKAGNWAGKAIAGSAIGSGLILGGSILGSGILGS